MVVEGCSCAEVTFGRMCWCTVSFVSCLSMPRKFWKSKVVRLIMIPSIYSMFSELNVNNELNGTS